MKTIKKTFEPIPDEKYENPLESPGLLTGFLTAIIIGLILVVGIISLVAASVYIADIIVKIF